MQQAATAPLGAKSFLATEESKVLCRELEQVRRERDILTTGVSAVRIAAVFKDECKRFSFPTACERRALRHWTRCNGLVGATETSSSQSVKTLHRAMEMATQESKAIRRLPQ